MKLSEIIYQTAEIRFSIMSRRMFSIYYVVYLLNQSLFINEWSFLNLIIHNKTLNKTLQMPNGYQLIRKSWNNSCCMLRFNFLKYIAIGRTNEKEIFQFQILIKNCGTCHQSCCGVVGFHPCVWMPGEGVVDEIPVYDQVQ